MGIIRTMCDVKPADISGQKKKMDYLKDKINELANNKNIRDLYRGINAFRKGHQPRNYLVEDENSDLLADSHNFLSRWNYFSQLLNVYNVSDVTQIEIHTAEPLVTDSSHLEVEIVIAKLKI
jgi:hypothetical protein